MRLGYLVSRYPAVSHTFIKREVQGLRSRGHDVTAWSVKRSDAADLLTESDREEAARTRHLLPTSPWTLVAAHLSALARPGAFFGTLAWALRAAPRGARLKHLMYFGEAMLLRRDAASRGVEHLHAHFANNSSDIAMIACEYCRRAGANPRTWSVTFHGSTDFYDVHRLRVGAKAEHADGVLCISDFARSQVMAFARPECWPNLRVARYGVDVSGPPPSPERPSPPLVLTVGRLAAVKGQTLLLDAVEQLAAAGTPFRVTILGEGPLSDHLRAEIRRRGLEPLVAMPGAQGYEAVERLYEQASVFCLTSFAEGLPIVLMEAMSHGVPVVATRVAGVPELVRDGHDGILVTPGRVDEIVAALGRLLGDEDLRRRLGLSAREQIEQRYSSHRSLDAIEAALRAASA